jgi:hypothetical protein
MLSSRPGNVGMVGRVTRSTVSYSGTTTDYYKTSTTSEYLLTNSVYALNIKAVADGFNSGNGSFLLDFNSQPGVEFEIPYQTNMRFRPAGDRNQTLNSRYGNSSAIFDQIADVNLMGFSGAAGLNDVRREIFNYYCAAGEDFSLHWYIGPAIIYSYTF